MKTYYIKITKGNNTPKEFTLSQQNKESISKLDKRVEKFLMDIRNIKMNIIAQAVGNNKYTDKLGTIKRKAYDPYYRDRSSKYLKMEEFLNSYKNTIPQLDKLSVNITSINNNKLDSNGWPTFNIL